EQGGIVSRDDGQVTGPDHVEGLVPLGYAVHAERVHGGVADRVQGGLGVGVRHRDEQQRGVVLLGDFGEAAQVRDGERVGERRRQVGREQRTDRAGAPPAQGTRGGVRPWVPE